MAVRLVTMLVALMALSLAAPRTLSAQSTKEIGKTSTGDPVFLELKSVKRDKGIITASIRARFAKPTKAPMGDLYSSRTIAMFDCAKNVVAVKENWYYLDQDGKKIGNHRVVGIPGYGPAFKGSVPDIAMTYLCAAK